MDFAWEKYKLEARKLLENDDDSHLSNARFGGRFVLDVTTIFIEFCS